MDARDFLRGALSLTGAADGLPVMCVPELALFATGRKRVLRLVLGRHACASLLVTAQRAGASYALSPVAACEIGNTWSSLSTTEDLASNLMMMVIAHDSGTADAVLRAETAGGTDFVGDALGYPDCCVSALPELSHAGARWAQVLVRRSGPGPHSWTANRLATAWGGMCAVGELFPCSLDCPQANALGLAATTALRDLGLVRLADALRGHGLAAVEVGDNGEVTLAQAGRRTGVVVEFRE